MEDAAFEALYDRYHRNLLSFCHHMLGSREEAEDVLQHTFLAAYRSLPSGTDVHVKSWLYTVARNRCLSVLRARRDAVSLDERSVASDGLAAEVDRRAELRALVRDVQRLPPDQRAALLLFELEDNSHDEIAAILGVRREKVKALVFQARETLMGWRAARETSCEEVREQLATLRGSALRRASIRRHVEQCAGCAEYESEVQRQKAALAIALPVVPAAGLKAAILAAAGSSGVALGAGAAASGGVAVGAKGIAVKLLAVVAVAGGAGTAGYVAAERVESGHGEKSAAAARKHAARTATAEPIALAPKVAAIATLPAGATDQGRALGTTVPHGKAAAPGQLKPPGTPAQGKALGHQKAKPRGAKHGRALGHHKAKPRHAKKPRPVTEDAHAAKKATPRVREAAAATPAVRPHPKPKPKPKPHKVPAAKPHATVPSAARSNAGGGGNGKH